MARPVVPTVGVGDENHGALDRVQQTMQVGNVVRQATQGIGVDFDRIAVALEALDHTMSPERRVFDGPVHKHDSRLWKIVICDLFLSAHDELFSFVLFGCGLPVPGRRVVNHSCSRIVCVYFLPYG